VDHEIRADEEADWLEAQKLQEEDLDMDDDSLGEPSYDQSDDELDELIAEWEKNEQAEL